MAVVFTTALPVSRGRIATTGILSYLFPRTETHKHQGIDFPKTLGTNVRSLTKGIVTDTGTELTDHFSGYGRFVQVQFVDPPYRPVWLLYAHLNDVKVKPGDTVEKGQSIGTVGKTCFNRQNPYKECEGAHLHFEVRSKQYLPSEGGRYDPVVFLAQHGEIDPAKLLEIKNEEKQRDTAIGLGTFAVVGVLGYILYKKVIK